MTDATLVERDTRVKIEDARPIHVGKAAADALREDVRQQLDDALGDLADIWSDTDVLDLAARQSVQSVQYRVIAANAAIEALVFLAPVEDIED